MGQKLAVQLSGNSLTFSLMLLRCFKFLAIVVGLRKGIVFSELCLCSLLRGDWCRCWWRNKGREGDDSPDSWLQALQLGLLSGAGGRLKRLYQSWEQADCKSALALEPTAVPVWCLIWGTGCEGPLVHLQEPADTEHRLAALQAWPVSAAEDSLPPEKLPEELVHGAVSVPALADLLLSIPLAAFWATELFDTDA